jgi:chemotaxis regulatin CheY-phosphate phosphatase CheZ
MNAAEAKHTSSETETKAIEGAIHAVVRANKTANTVVDGQDALAAGAASVADIEKLMAELLVARDYLDAEGERVRRVNANYLRLAQTASVSVQVIAESLGKWRVPEQEGAGILAGPPLNQPDEGDSQNGRIAS